MDETPAGDLPESSITPPLIDAPAPAAETSAPAVSVIDIDTIAPIDFSEADAQFFAELSAAAAGFRRRRERLGGREWRGEQGG